jgi:hypothetical protein
LHGPAFGNVTRAARLGRGARQTSERVVRLVVPRIIVVAGLSAIAIAASGCLGDSDAVAESPPSTATEQVETQPPAQPTVDISKFRAAFKETFAERPWYDQITGMKMTAHRILRITTKLDPDSDSLETDAGTICRAAFGLASAEVVGGIRGVEVVGSGGVGGGGCA